MTVLFLNKWNNFNYKSLNSTVLAYLLGIYVSTFRCLLKRLIESVSNGQNNE